MPEGAVRHPCDSCAPASRCTRQPTRNAEIERFDSIDIVRRRDRRKTPVSVLKALRSLKYAKAQVAAPRAQSRRAVRPVLTTGACLAAPGAPLRIGVGVPPSHHGGKPPHAVALLRTRRERPHRRAAEQRDEGAP